MKPDRVAQQHGPPAGQLPAAGPRVERGEQGVLDENVGAGQGVQQRALAGVGVADQRDGHLPAAGGHLALLRRSIVFSSLPQIGDPLLDHAAVHFQLLFARPAQADALLLPRQVGPHPLQPRHGVFQLGQLDGQAGFVRLCPAGEDVENQLRAVQDLHAGDFFQVACLAGTQVVVEDDHVGVGGRGQAGQLGDLALAQVGGGVGGLAALGQLADHPRAGGGGQAFQFFQRLAVAGPAGQQHADQDGGLAGPAVAAVRRREGELTSAKISFGSHKVREV